MIVKMAPRGVADGGGGVRGLLTPALLKIGSFDPPDSGMKWPKSGVFSDFYGILV